MNLFAVKLNFYVPTAFIFIVFLAGVEKNAIQQECE